MQQKGVLYDVGRVLGGQEWRPDYTPELARRELEIIRMDLQCNAIRLCGYDLRRLLATAEQALEQGLYVWLSPELWNAKPHAHSLTSPPLPLRPSANATLKAGDANGNTKNARFDSWRGRLAPLRVRP